MTTSKKTTAAKTAEIKKDVADTAETVSDRVTDTAEKVSDNVESITKTAINRAKEAIPSLDGVTSAASTAASDATAYIQDHTNVDVQRMADDATAFVRRNPGTSLAAAAGLGVLIGVLATTKRS